MKDWSDIFAEELKDIEVSLPEDDWDVVCRKYDAAKRRRKAAMLWRASAVASVAAAVAVLIVLFAGGGGENIPDPDVLPNVIADAEMLESQDSEEVFIVESEDTGDINVVRDASSAGAEGLVADAVMSETPESPEPVAIPETSEITENTEIPEKPEAAVPEESDEADIWTSGDWIGDDVPERTMPRKRNISLALSGGGVFAGGYLPAPAMDMAPDASAPLPPEDSDNPSDTSSFQPGTEMPQQARMTIQRNRRVLSQDMDHYQPVSYGVSARFTLTERFSVNTGVNYTLYASKRTTRYSDGTMESDRQMVHYLGIPLRFDWMLVRGKRFGMYLGVGTQVDKCVYARCGTERLYDSSFLWSLNGALGMQYNITNRFSLYLEPEIIGNLNHSQIETYRSDSDVMLTARIGLRFNL